MLRRVSSLVVVARHVLLRLRTTHLVARHLAARHLANAGAGAVLSLLSLGPVPQLSLFRLALLLAYVGALVILVILVGP